MKKFLILAAFLFLIAVPAQAATTDYAKDIAKLKSQIASLTAKLADLEAKATQKPSPSKEGTLSISGIEVRNTIFKAEGYGGFEIEFIATASGADIYIPMTTTDSTRGETGVSYTLKGDDFSGLQLSKVSCSTKAKGYCKIKNGKSSPITATVWLTPKESGNYAVQFTTLGYKVGNTKEDLTTLKLNKKTETLYLW
ncbi:MAG TPA: hypothetical protein VGB97_01250 [Candidatus Paceibacterota bacterium]|jgi:hypothetical protein